MSKMTEVIVYDKENKQIDYQYMAREKTSGKLVIGNLVVEKPWYQSKHYFIYFNKYKSGDFCGGVVDLGLDRVEIDPNTIVPFTQLAKIKWNQENGIETKVDQIKNSWNGYKIIGVSDKFERTRCGMEIYDMVKITAVEKVLGKFGDNRFSDSYEHKFSQKENFKAFGCRLIDEQKKRRRKELIQALLEFWNEYGRKYCSIVIGLSNGDCLYIKEVPGSFQVLCCGMIMIA